MGPGATIGILGTGVPRLACLRPAAWLHEWPSTNRLCQPTLKTLVRAKPREADDTRPPRERPHHAGSQGVGEIKARGSSRGSRDASHDDQGQASVSPQSILISPLVLGGAQARSTEASGKGFHIGATRPRPAGRQDGGHRGAQDGLTTSAFGKRRPPLVRIACTSCPLSKWPLLDPFPLNIWEEDQALYI